ncbi:MAG: hypothetical protein EBU88_05005 [Acidobacteria bacterium]|nr:hypothetical protein [Acidobacteriota bacterium]
MLVKVRLQIVFLALVPIVVSAQDRVTPGRLIVEPPTIHNLGFEWKIGGDDNRNATVRVEYRRGGTVRWHDAMPLLRIGDEKVWRSREYLEYLTPRMFAGSILDVEEGTTYECRFTMSDPDGVDGKSVEVVYVTTRRVPQSFSGGRTLHVYPPDYEGPRVEPSFKGLKEAYYGPGLGDWDVVHTRPVQPGDVILVHAGLYRADRLDYVTPYGIPFDGTYVLTRDGTAERPIVIRSAGDGEAIFDGNGCSRLFDVMGANYNYFEGLTIRNTDVAFYAGHKDLLGPSGLVVRNCRIEDVGVAVMNEYAGSRNFYIADNIILGRDDRHRLIGWSHWGRYRPSQLKSYYAIKVYGQGHVICHNYIAWFHDGVCVSTYGLPPEEPDQQGVAIDIYNNDLHLMVDDFVEADGGVHNIRVARNRGFNAAQHGFSGQPVFGGPVYFYRNIAYNVAPITASGGAIKTGGANPAGVLVYHNTFIAEISNINGHSNSHYRNNLILGTNHSTKPLLGSLTYTSYTSFDYNGWRPNPGDQPQFLWGEPGASLKQDFSLTASGLVKFRTLAEFQRETGQEKHGRLVDYDAFRRVQPPDPAQPHRVYAAGEFDFSLNPEGQAVDAGCIIPNINDRYVGRAPDLGALEAGQPAPVYGPRSQE